MANVNDIAAGFLPIVVQASSAALSSSTAAAGQLTPTAGAGIVYMANTGATPGTYTTRTVAQMLGDAPMLSVGQAYILVLANNQGTGTLTLAGGTGVTVSGTATVAANTARVFNVTVNTATTMTFNGLAIGFSSNV